MFTFWLTLSFLICFCELQAKSIPNQQQLGGTDKVITTTTLQPFKSSQCAYLVTGPPGEPRTFQLDMSNQKFHQFCVDLNSSVLIVAIRESISSKRMTVFMNTIGSRFAPNQFQLPEIKECTCDLWCMIYFNTFLVLVLLGVFIGLGYGVTALFKDR